MLICLVERGRVKKASASPLGTSQDTIISTGARGCGLADGMSSVYVLWGMLAEERGEVGIDGRTIHLFFSLTAQMSFLSPCGVFLFLHGNSEWGAHGRWIVVLAGVALVVGCERHATCLVIEEQT